MLDLSQMADRWRAFGWDAQDVDGHDIQQMVRAMEPVKDDDGPPRVLVAETVFGRGVPFMEKQSSWHYLLMSDEQFALALEAGGSTRLRRSFLPRRWRRSQQRTIGSFYSPATSATWRSNPSQKRFPIDL